MTLAVRPRKVILTPVGVDVGEHFVGLGKVVAEEWRGEEAYTAVELIDGGRSGDARHWWWAVKPKGEAIQIGQQVRIWSQAGAVWFDAATGQRV